MFFFFLVAYSDVDVFGCSYDLWYLHRWAPQKSFASLFLNFMCLHVLWSDIFYWVFVLNTEFCNCAAVVSMNWLMLKWFSLVNFLFVYISILMLICLAVLSIGFFVQCNTYMVYSSCTGLQILILVWYFEICILGKWSYGIALFFSIGHHIQKCSSCMQILVSSGWIDFMKVALGFLTFLPIYSMRVSWCLVYFIL